MFVTEDGARPTRHRPLRAVHRREPLRQPHAPSGCVLRRAEGRYLPRPFRGSRPRTRLARICSVASDGNRHLYRRFRWRSERDQAVPSRGGHGASPTCVTLVPFIANAGDEDEADTALGERAAADRYHPDILVCRSEPLTTSAQDRPVRGRRSEAVAAIDVPTPIWCRRSSEPGPRSPGLRKLGLDPRSREWDELLTGRARAGTVGRARRQLCDAYLSVHEAQARRYPDRRARPRWVDADMSRRSARRVGGRRRARAAGSARRVVGGKIACRVAREDGIRTSASALGMHVAVSGSPATSVIPTGPTRDLTGDTAPGDRLLPTEGGR